MSLPPMPSASPLKFLQGLASRLERWLVSPSQKIVGKTRRRNARLLSIFLLCLFLLFLSINLVYLFSVPGYHIPAADLIGYAFMLLTYLISRTRFTGVALVVLLVMFPMNVFDNVLEGTSLNLMATLSFLIPSFILASIFLNPWATAAYGYGINALVLLLPLLAPQRVSTLSQVLGSVSVGTVVVTLCIIWIVHRNRIERDHQVELKAVYDATLEGWSRALEIRDQGTEGHSQRVVDLTLRLGRASGLHGTDLDALYRGALLHDIGKMAIPDAILLKPSALDEAEWKVMRTHPTIAYNMLAAIAFLRPALVIPACHHEWWNGQGYPGGLSGEQIPLPARVFAVVDVWDALLSDRPYRQAWTREAAVQYLQEQSGKQFDPQIVERFLALNP